MLTPNYNYNKLDTHIMNKIFDYGDVISNVNCSFVDKFTHNIYKKRQKVEILLWSINLNTTSLSTLESYIQAYRNKKLTIERQCAKKIIHTIYIKTQPQNQLTYINTDILKSIITELQKQRGFNICILILENYKNQNKQYWRHLKCCVVNMLKKTNENFKVYIKNNGTRIYIKIKVVINTYIMYEDYRWNHY